MHLISFPIFVYYNEKETANLALKCRLPRLRPKTFIYIFRPSDLNFGPFRPILAQDLLALLFSGNIT